MNIPHKNALGHIGMGLLLMATFAVAWHLGSMLLGVANAVLSAFVGWAMQCAYWLGRERRDHELEAEKAGRQIEHGLGALREWNPLEWGADGRRDLFAPILAGAALAALLAAWGWS